MDPKKAEWNEIISSKFKEGMSIEDLNFEYEPGIVIEPNILESDVSSINHPIEIQNPWINMAEISGRDADEMNGLALKALQEGANGLSFKIAAKDSVKELLNEIMTEYLEVRIDCQNLSNEEISAKKAELNTNNFPNVRWVNNKTAVKEYSIPSTKRVAGIRKVTQALEEGAQNVDVKVWLSKNFLFEIASLRAIRSLLQEKVMGELNIIAAYGVEGINDLGDYNLIEKTYKILSGVIGGANEVLTDYKGDEDSRLTLNIHNILDLESGLKNVMDPVGGAFYIEKLTGEIIRQVREESH